MNVRALLLALLTLLIAPVALAQQSYDHVVIVLDASGSMRETFGNGVSKMSSAKAALKQVLENTPPDTRIGLLVFGEKSGWAFELDRRNDAVLNAAIDAVGPSGGTPLGFHLKVGADALLTAREAQHGYGTYRLLIVTDGAASDKKLVTKYTPLLLERGIVLDVIGVRMQADHMLKGVAHTYRSADDPDSLIAAVREVFAEVSVGGDDEVGSDAFEVLDGLPDSFALASIQALASSPALNHPIGSKPPKKPSKGGNAESSGSPPAPPGSCSHVPLGGSLWLAALFLIRRRK